MAIKFYSEKIKRKRGWEKKNIIPLNYSMTRAILDILIDSSEHITLFETPYQHMKRMWREERGIPEPKRWRYNRAIRYLERFGQIKVVPRGDKHFVELTKKGKLKVFLEKIHLDIRDLQKWDGKWRLVIWDIPESSRRQRNQIRYFLKKLGFFRLQQSVFITPYPLPQSAVNYLKTSGLIEFMRFLRVDKIDDDAKLKKHFGLL